MSPDIIPAWQSDCRPANNLLRILSESDYERLAPHLQIVQGRSGDVLYRPGTEVDFVYFPCGPALLSSIVMGQDGREVETILIGREGAIGGVISTSQLPSYCRIAVQFDGPLVQLPVCELEEARAASRSLNRVFARYADCLLAQLFQSTACNATHPIEQRLAKWIIAAMDRTGDSVVPLSHEQLAALVGVGRSYASRVMGVFKEQSILATQRGSVRVRDRAQLHARACACNELVRAHFDKVLPGAYPSQELQSEDVPELLENAMR